MQHSDSGTSTSRSATPYREIFANANDAIGIIDLQGRYIEQNDAHRSLLGYDDAELVGQTPALHMGEETFRQVAETLASTGKFQGEVSSRAKDGRTLEIDLSAFAVCDESGAPVCLVGIKRDVTERNRARAALRLNEEKLRLLIQNSGDAILIADDEGAFVDANPAACRMFGRTHEELLGLHVGDLITPEGASAEERFVSYLQNGYESGEFSFTRADGSVRVTEYSACRFAPGLHLSILRDVTERREIEAELRRSEARFRAMFEQSPLSVQILAPDGKTVQVNRAWEKLWGATLADIADYNVRHDPQLDARGVSHLIEQAFHGEPAEIPPIAYNPDETIPGLNAHDDPVRWTRAVIYPVKDESGAIREVVLTHEDITTRVRAEERLAKNQAHIEGLYERLQNAMVETHHRVKNNLQIIAAMIDLRVMDGHPTVPITELKRLARHVRTLAMVHELLTEQAKADGEAHVVSAREVLEHLLPLLRQISHNHSIHFELEEVYVSSRQATALSLVTNELVSNAVKHGRERVAVTLARHENRARLTVEDDGPGFQADFDSERASNTGLELVNRLSRWDLHGEIGYANVPSGGASVQITFPTASSKG